MRFTASTVACVLLCVPLPAQGDELFKVENSQPQLRVLDPFTGVIVRSVTMTTMPATAIYGGNGLAVHPVSRQLYVILGARTGPRRLATVDPLNPLQVHVR